METFANYLLGFGTVAILFFCAILNRRLRKLNNMEAGIGAAISQLSSEVETLVQIVERNRSKSETSTRRMKLLIDLADEKTKNLELLIASLHDIPEREKCFNVKLEARSVDRPEFIRSK